MRACMGPKEWYMPCTVLKDEGGSNKRTAGQAVLHASCCSCVCGWHPGNPTALLQP